MAISGPFSCLFKISFGSLCRENPAYKNTSLGLVFLYDFLCIDPDIAVAIIKI